MPAFDAGHVITLVVALAAAFAAWGATRQKVQDLERRVGVLDGARDELIRLQERFSGLEKTVEGGFREIRDDLRQALRPQARRKAVGEE